MMMVCSAVSVVSCSFMVNLRIKGINLQKKTVVLYLSFDCETVFVLQEEKKHKSLRTNC
jgi:hypothetical protein